MPLIILFLALPIFAQGPAPDWLEESRRLAHYPKSEWYTGFAMDKIKGQPGKKEFEAMEANAKNKLSESIIVNVKGTSTVQTTSVQTQKSETINTNYGQNVKTTTNAFLANVDFKSYFDKKTGYIYGFAVVRKDDLANFYRSNINSLFAFANKELSIIEQIAEQGKKNQAMGKIQAIEDSLKKVSYWGSYLNAVDVDNSYTAREKDIWLKINNAKMSLERGTNVFLDVTGLEPERLSAQMQDKNCNCTIAETADNADYVVKIKAKLSRCTENQNKDVFCYASADVSVNNTKFQKPLDIKIPEAKGGWTNGDKEKATEEAFKQLIYNMAEKIVQAINK
jgi:hypothetical protein